jgi:hypothetical protein
MKHGSMNIDLDTDGRIILKYMLKEQDGLIYLKICKSGGFFYTRSELRISQKGGL